MASNPYVKSFLWLIGFSGLGYGLLILTAPSEKELAKIRAAAGVHLTEDERKKILFLKKLREAANLKPDTVHSKKPDN